MIKSTYLWVMTIAPVVRFSQEVEAIRLRREWSDSRRGKQYDAARSASFNIGLQPTPSSLRSCLAPAFRRG